MINKKIRRKHYEKLKTFIYKVSESLLSKTVSLFPLKGIAILRQFF